MTRRLLLLNGIAICGVILFHASGWGYVAMFSWAHRYLPVTSPNYDQVGSLSYYALRFIEQVVVFALPAFLFVSGFFIAVATGRRPNVGWNLVWARIKYLVIPYLIWSFVLFFAFFLQGIVLSPGGYLVMLLTGRTNPAYYYVPLLVQFYLLSPILVPLAKRWWLALLIVAAVIQLLVQLTYYPVLLGMNLPGMEPYLDLFPKWLFPTRIFWFTLGVVVGFNLTAVKQLLERIKWGLLAMALILIPLGIIEWELMLHYSGRDWFGHRETILDTLYSLAFILAFLAFEKFAIPYAKGVSDLGTRSFGIYLIHSPVMEYVSRGIFHLAPWILGYQIILQPVLIIYGLWIPLMLMTIVDRSQFRRYYLYIFG